MDFPKLTVVVPVLNGAATLPRLLDSLLVQTFKDLQVAVIDNASTDETQAIAEKYREADSRVIYLRHRENLGVAVSHESGLHLGFFSSYVAYVGHNDYWAPEYAERCVAALEAEPAAVLAYTGVNNIDDEGRIVSQGRDDYEISGPDPGARYLTFLEKVNWCTAYLGVIRSDYLKKVKPLMQHNNAAGDNLFLARLALLGPFIQLPEPLFYRDKPGAAAAETFARRYGRLCNMGKNLNLGITLPFCRWVRYHCDAVLRADLSGAEKDRLCRETIRILLNRYRPSFQAELDRAIDLILKGEIHKNWEDELEKKPVIQRRGVHQALDFVQLARLVQELNYALGLLPRHPGLNCALGAVLSLLGRHEEALALFEKELQHNPGCEPAKGYAEQYRKKSRPA